MMRFELDILLTQIFIIIVILIEFLINGNPLTLFIIFGALLIVLWCIFRIKNYNPQIYTSLVVSDFILQGLTLVYTFIFRLIYLKEIIYMALFLVFLVIFIVLLILYYRHWQIMTKFQ